MGNRKGIRLMNLTYKKAEITDASCLAEIYNAAFYRDFIRYGTCPGYGKTKESMEYSIIHAPQCPKYVIMKDGSPAGAVAFENRQNGEYYLACLCIIPEFQGMGIGTKTIQDFLRIYSDWKRISLVTPADKEENIAFYTKRCGFHIENRVMDGNVELVNLCMER